MSKSESEILDLEDRDPQNLNRHIEVSWENIIGEPQTIRSPECAWTISQYCFKFSRLGVYACFSVLCAPIAACIMGTTYALFYFQYIWCCVPCLRLCKISCGVTRSFVQAFSHGIIIPLMEALGHILSQIKMRTGPIDQPNEDKQDVEKILIV